ncbi:hypothetical protein Kfla_6886 [Kribbella flavida DSM 17836]|uniref:Uncharacterized protein n=1 Tax=Kribbella flavida (strain DSM 17836 / JCM 10339 / NBRC 14399) TaxID=479435 RepID=D2Q2H9_KRIFD|nr:hypothetical protein Kfla_6886 [Kribbella flavida DSM 17836]
MTPPRGGRAFAVPSQCAQGIFIEFFGSSDGIFSAFSGPALMVDP